MKHLLREPLVHFLVLGAALFAAFSTLARRDDGPPDAIVVSAGKIEHLAALFARTWRRPPTREEIEDLVEDFIREEVAYREGTAIGLDRDDTVIRRRIRQKLEFIAEDLTVRAEPGDGELAAYLAAHPDAFRIDPRLTFRHVYLDPSRRGDAVERDARELMTALNGDPSVDASTLGDRILLEHGYRDLSVRDVAGLFGQAFGAGIVDLEPGAWRGPIESGYGVHLVIVDERRGGRLPELDEVRDQVRREWDNARRPETTERFYRNMLDRYEIVIEWPQAGPSDESS